MFATKPDIPDKRPRLWEKIFFVLAILIFSSILFCFKSKDINSKLAYSGWSPRDYVAHKLHPENFSKDWPSGILNNDNSLVMRTYYYVAKYLKLDPAVSVYPFMLLQILVFLFSVAFLTRALFNDRFVSLTAVAILSVSSLAGLNLSRFGLGYASLLSFPLYYGYAAAFCFFSFGFYLENKYYFSFLFLGLAVYCHINIGFFAVGFIMFFLVLKPRQILDKRVWTGLLLFVLMLVPHLAQIISTSNLFTGSIPSLIWISITRLFSFHWYPLTMGLFTFDSYADLFPTLLVLVYFFVSLRYQSVRDDKIKKIISGFAACVIMTAFGIFFAEIVPVPIFIKISLHRSTEFISFFGVIFIIHYLTQKIKEGNILKIALSVLAMMTLMLSRPGLAILPIFLLLFFDIKDGRAGLFKINGPWMKIAKAVYSFILAGILFVALLPYYGNLLKTPIWGKILSFLWLPFHYLDPGREPDFLIRGGNLKIPISNGHLFALGICFLVFVVVAMAWKRSENQKRNSLDASGNKMERLVQVALLSIIFLVSGSIVYFLNRSEYLLWKGGAGEISRSYLEVQLWAKNNTSKESLFLIDPAHSYGWRDYSERSSFGNLREWTYTIICYNPDFQLLQRGLQRLREFGIELSNISEQDLKRDRSLLRGAKLTEDIRHAFYTMSDDRLKELCSKYQIDFIVFGKQFIKKEYDPAVFKREFENKYYLILKPLKNPLS